MYLQCEIEVGITYLLLALLRNDFKDKRGCVADQDLYSNIFLLIAATYLLSYLFDKQVHIYGYRTFRLSKKYIKNHNYNFATGKLYSFRG